MLRNTFLHLPGIGYKYERLLWESGVLTWDDFLSAPSLPSALDGRRDRLSPLVEESVKRHDSGDAVFFARALPSPRGFGGCTPTTGTARRSWTSRRPASRPTPAI